MIVAIYEGGVLRPLRPLSLPEHSRVQLRLVKSGSREESERERAIRALLGTGRVGRLRDELISASVSSYERHEPPTIPGPSLSDTIIAQRRGDL
jgi:predicted DNA-binding antitoxin AbrB/MazE fold protein